MFLQRDDLAHGGDDLAHGYDDLAHGGDDLAHGYDDLAHVRLRWTIDVAQRAASRRESLWCHPERSAPQEREVEGPRK